VNDASVLDRVRATNRFPTGVALPDASITPELALTRIERRLGMRTEEAKRDMGQPRALARPPGRRLLAVAALGGVVAIAVLSIWIASPAGPGGDAAFTDTGEDLSPVVRAEALDGEPSAVAEAWFWAFWSGDDALLLDLSDETITGPGYDGDHIDDMIAYATFEQILRGPGHAFVLEGCSENTAVGEQQCWVVSDGTHASYEWPAGERFLIRLKVTDGLVERYTFEFDRARLSELYGLALSVDRSAFEANCAGGNEVTELIDANNYPEALSPGCASFIREVIDGG